MEENGYQARSRLEQSATHLLHRMGQGAGEIFAAEVGTQGLTPRQYAILLTVSQHEGLSQTDLVARTGIDRSTLADVIRRMLKKGYLRRKRTESDARAYAVRLTPLGRDALRSAEPAALRADERLLASLTPERRAEFLHCLNVIVEAIAQRERVRSMAARDSRDGAED